MLTSKTTLALAVSALVLAGAVTDASARQVSRSRTVTTPSGETYSSSTDINSSYNGDGSASRSVTHVGPGGGVTTVNGNVSCTDVSCTHTRQVTGPNGGTITRTRTRHR